jgi:hypothetical protein
VLHVTNGDCAVDVLRRAGMGGDILPWQDVLHEGPVDASLSLEKISAKRAAFIAEAGWGPKDKVARRFRERDERLIRAGGDDEVVLWFEHDLYDQLQLIQVLDWFAAHPHPKLALVCEAEYLGEMKPERAAELFQKRTGVSPAQLATGTAAWKTFGSNRPDKLQSLDTSSLAFLGAALLRHLEEFPWDDDGLARSERQIFEVLDKGPAPFAKIFRETQALEDPRFLGDSVLLWYLDRMQREGTVRRMGDVWESTDDEPAMHLPRWLGGVLVDDDCPWRWDAGARRLVS